MSIPRYTVKISGVDMSVIDVCGEYTFPAFVRVTLVADPSGYFVKFSELPPSPWDGCSDWEISQFLEKGGASMLISPLSTAIVAELTAELARRKEIVR